MADSAGALATGREAIDLGRTRSTDDLSQLLGILPPHLRKVLEHHADLNQLVEVVMDFGRLPEARFPGARTEALSDKTVTRDDLDYAIARVGHFGGDNRAGIEQTLHRISAIRNRRGETIGLTCRVGRAVFGTIATIRDLVESGKSILMLGRPGVGKTTALREIARVLADELQKRVVIIDTSNEIAGDGDVPHPAIGRSRRMQVAEPELQHKVMIEAVENHMPEVIVIDEIGTELEALAARTIAERGVQLVGTAHGNQLANLIKNPTLSDLVGGIQSVTLGDEEARRRGSQKTVLERKAPPTFEVAVEMQERSRWVVHDDVATTVDSLLRGRIPERQVRTISDTGKVTITHELPEADAAGPDRSLAPAGRNGGPSKGDRGWRSSGQMTPVPPNRRAVVPLGADVTPHETFTQLLDRQDYHSPRLLDETDDLKQNGYLYVYPYAVSRHQLEQAIRLLNLPVILTKELDTADAVLALRTHLKNHTKLRHLAKTRQLPIYILKSNSTAHIARTLRRILKLDDEGGELEPVDLRLFADNNASDDELEALEEARLAVENIVLPKGQPVELLPRSGRVRKMQHELIEHYKLTSTSFGEEPNRRLRIFPA
ncbi:MAG: AAA family ATPase [Oscillatoriales cyanobacterium]|nr:MAG: AAA family ATPase [Oscillatoriales cyanobacterium]